MVVLEPAPSTSEEENRRGNPKSNSAAAINSSEVDTSEGKGDGGGYVSDGFETASETDANDDDEGCNYSRSNEKDDLEQKQVQQPEQHQEGQSVSAKDHSFEDALNDDELLQKTLADVNEAKLEGNKLFGDGKFEEAVLKYDSALQLAPEAPPFVEIRSICYANRATCFFKMGKYEDTVKECTKALELNPTYMKALLRREEAHEKLSNYEEAIADLTKIVELDPSNIQAKRTIVRLEPLAREKREKLKEEMIGKLKEMGNSILGRFGMSTDNFKAVQDPNTGSYSIQFQR